MLVEGLLVDRCLGAIVGRWKHGKTWGVLELAISITTGEPAFGVREVLEPGPVILILEESGRPALHRRLDALARGRAIERDRLHTLYAASNQRVRLDDGDWLARLTDAANELEARAVFLDPLVRLRAAGLDENSQREFAVVIEACATFEKAPARRLSGPRTSATRARRCAAAPTSRASGSHGSRSSATARSSP